jgi:hypothetical protein
MAITFKPFDELFAPAYQLTYISINGHIDVGPNTYDVFHNYTMQKRQQIFQVCKKHLPWEYTQEQEQWERTMYMYQFVIKSPAPFPYSEYKLSAGVEFLIYDTDHWMNKLTSGEITKYTKKDEYFPEKVAGQYQRGDVIETRPLGFWTGPKARGFNKKVFRVIAVPGSKADNRYKQTTSFYKSRFKISTNSGDITTVNSINDLTITDKGA